MYLYYQTLHDDGKGSARWDDDPDGRSLIHRSYVHPISRAAALAVAKARGATLDDPKFPNDRVLARSVYETSTRS